ncbi:DNA polymerase IV [Heyndrickxia camelliae]|uniref:DNA polymerase IV n=1 Tax=Heyndrickxia camelliae TaxID=1707093 RepID=A0A2N3LN67_9BACI|nr:DNA polymerase IV [Heyndrickxia camelliae]PKR85999.1 DNA polymerase IV [Heyndrickxia camelliae]
MKQYYPKNGRVILHVDMNSFFAAVEMAYDSSLKGKPLAIAGNPDERKGIVVTCSYEARKFGVKTTMTVWEAKKLCPQIIIMRPNFQRYREASTAMFSILRQYSNLVEPVSIDEGYIDITESSELGTPIQIAEKIQKQLVQELDLPCSIGIAPNKFLAKMASDMKKPMGITILRKRDVPDKLWPLPLIEMHGIGKKTAEKLSSIGIRKICDLAKADDIQLRHLLGVRGLQLKERANGEDKRKVDPDSANEFKSVGSSLTLPKDIANQHELLAYLKKLSEETANRLKKKEYYTTNVSITIRYKNRQTITRSRKLQNPIYKMQDIFAAAKDLFLKHWNGNPVRLLGVTGQDLVERFQAVEQLDLFSYEKEAKKEPLYNAMEMLRKKFGKHAVTKGVSLKGSSHRPSIKDDIDSI